MERISQKTRPHASRVPRLITSEQLDELSDIDNLNTFGNGRPNNRSDRFSNYDEQPPRLLSESALQAKRWIGHPDLNSFSAFTSVSHTPAFPLGERKSTSNPCWSRKQYSSLRHPRFVRLLSISEATKPSNSEPRKGDRSGSLADGIPSR